MFSSKPPQAKEMARVLFPAFIGKDDVVIEVGADVGGSTYVLSKLSKQVYAFEPNPFSFTHLERSMRKARNVQVFKLGAGAAEETVNFKLPQLAKMPRGSRSMPVNLIRLDAFKFNLVPTCLVMDCGGAELKVLKGAEGLFKSQAIWTAILETHQLTDSINTATETTLWLLDHGLKTQTREARDGSLWVTAVSSKRTVWRGDIHFDGNNSNGPDVPT